MSNTDTAKPESDSVETEFNGIWLEAVLRTTLAVEDLDYLLQLNRISFSPPLSTIDRKEKAQVLRNDTDESTLLTQVQSILAEWYPEKLDYAAAQAIYRRIGTHIPKEMATLYTRISRDPVLADMVRQAVEDGRLDTMFTRRSLRVLIFEALYKLDADEVGRLTLV